MWSVRDTGLGRDGYSIIGQGKIDSIISAHSDDRREIFEEAAGVSKIKYRKIESEKKLSLVEENLVRLKDILSELEVRVEPLKKQSENASNYILYSDEKKKLEIGIWLNTLNKSLKELETFDDKILDATNKQSKIDDEIEEVQKESDDIFKKINSQIKSTDEIRGELSQIDCKINDIKSSVSVFENDILRNEAEISDIDKEIIKNSNILEDLKSNINRQESELVKLKDRLKSKEQGIKREEEGFSDIREKIEKIDKEIEVLNKKSKEISDKISEHKLNGVTAQSSVEEISNRINDNNKSKKAKEEKIEIYNEELLKVNDRREKNREAIETTTNKLNGYRLSIEGKQSKYDICKEEINKIYIDKEDLTRRLDMLENLQNNLEGFSESVKVIMKESGHNRLKGIHGPVSKVISVNNEYATAIDIALGQSIQNIIVDNEDDAKNAINLLKARRAGRVTFLPISTIKSRVMNKGIKGEYIGIASDLCRCSEKYREIINFLLGRILVVDRLDNAIDIAKKNDYRFKIVTLDGQVVNAGGSLTGGSHNQKLNIISRTNEIQDLKNRILETSKRLDNRKNDLKNYEEELKKLKSLEIKTNDDLNKEKKDSIDIDLSYQNIINSIKLEESSINQINKDNEGLEIRIRNINERIKEFKESLDENMTLSESTKEELDNKNASKSELMLNYESLNKKIHDFEIDIVSMKKELDSESMKVKFLEDSYEDREEKIKNLDNKINKLRQDNKDLSENIISYKKDLDTCNRTKLDLEERVNNNSLNRMELEKKSTEFRNKERDLNLLKETIVRDLSRLEERKDNLQRDYDSTISKLWEEYELTKRQAEEEYKEIDDFEDGQKRVNDLKNKIKRLGAVNIEAIEEYKEVSDRYNFMKEQIEDVDRSKTELTKLIYELTTTMRNTFMTKFNMINERFKETFKELFGGGEADLELTVPEDYLNSGIRIIVQPPGKIVSNMELLSGGEKALVAISLYFAIMKVSPSPFCVLDEIEAALDDVNVDRFASYLSKMSDNTQFIVITHRRGTMEEADILYGVTMQEEGISNLLRLDVSEIDKIKNN